MRKVKKSETKIGKSKDTNYIWLGEHKIEDFKCEAIDIFDEKNGIVRNVFVAED